MMRTSKRGSPTRRSRGRRAILFQSRRWTSSRRSIRSFGRCGLGAPPKTRLRWRCTSCHIGLASPCLSLPARG